MLIYCSVSTLNIYIWKNHYHMSRNRLISTLILTFGSAFFLLAYELDHAHNGLRPGEVTL